MLRSRGLRCCICTFFSGRNLRIVFLLVQRAKRKDRAALYSIAFFFFSFARSAIRRKASRIASLSLVIPYICLTMAIALRSDSSRYIVVFLFIVRVYQIAIYMSSKVRRIDGEQGLNRTYLQWIETPKRVTTWYSYQHESVRNHLAPSTLLCYTNSKLQMPPLDWCRLSSYGVTIFPLIKSR